MLTKIQAHVEKITKKQLRDLTSLGMEYLEKGLYKKSQKIFKRINQSDKENVDSHYLLGRAYWQRGLLDQAAGSFVNALQLDPTHLHSYLELGDYYHNEYNLELAAKIYKKVLSLYPEDVDAYIELMAVSLKMGNPSYVYMPMAQEIFEQEPTETLRIINMLVRHNKIQTALQESANKKRQFNDLDILAKTSELIYAEKYAESEDLLIKAIAADPANEDLYCQLGISDVYQYNYELGEVSFRKAIQLAPDVEYLYHQLGVALYWQNKFYQAEKIFTHGLKLYIEKDEEYAEDYLYLTMLKVLRGDDQMLKTQYFNRVLDDPKLELDVFDELAAIMEETGYSYIAKRIEQKMLYSTGDN